MIRVTNIRIREMADLIIVECPNCHRQNTYVISNGHKFTSVRTCLGCGAVVEFDCEEVE